MKGLCYSSAVILFFLFSSALYAQEKDSKIESIPDPKIFVTQHQIVNGGKTVKYKATASETYLKNKEDKPVASIWTVAYTQDGISDSNQRPVTFIFNGGPGSASIWLHMGFLGPEIVKVSSDATEDDGAAPYQLVKNNLGMLDQTDLVFIDPVGTGYSRVIGEGKVEDFWGLNEDANSIAQFIRLWITENKRWFSPKYILGESFGTTRAVAVANLLEGNGQNMAINGLILISQALDYAGSTSVNDNITSYLTYLPSMAATAWYHKKAGQDKSLEAFVEEARLFTYDQYAPALYRGNLLKPEDREQIASKLVYFTSLDKDYILRSNLRILIPRFQKKLLEKEGLALGRLDGRFMGDEIDDVTEYPHLGDASDYQVDAAFTASLNYYFQKSLSIEMDRPYITSNEEIGNIWKWRNVPENQYWEPTEVNVARQLGETMRRNSDLKVFVAAGYYDLICPFFDTEYTFSRNGIDHNRVNISYFEAGHMMYLHDEDFRKLASEIRLFLSK